MKNIMICVLAFLLILALIKGLINNIAAPVVPIHDANDVPISNNIKLNFGVPIKSPLIKIPPDIVNRANNKTIKGIYSKKIA